MVRSGLLIAIVFASLAALAEAPTQSGGGKAASAEAAQKPSSGQARQALPKHRGSLAGKGLARRPSKQKSSK